MGKFIALLIALVLIIFVIGTVKSLEPFSIKTTTSQNAQDLASNMLPITSNSSTSTNVSTDSIDQTDIYHSQLGNDILIGYPVNGQKVKSPLIVSGSIPSTWLSSTGTFTATLTDWDGLIISQEKVKLTNFQEDGFTPFKATLPYTFTGDNHRGVVILKSGNKKNPQTLEIVVNLF